MVGTLNFAYEYGELSNSQKEAIITLIEKKDIGIKDICQTGDQFR